MRWWTADLHLGHHNIIEYCNRPWSTVEEMNEGLIERWNDVVHPNDEVWVLGDFAMGHRAETVPLARRLHGAKILIPGNHDHCHPLHRAHELYRRRYLDWGFSVVLPGLFRTGLDGQDETIMVWSCHFPPVGDSRHEDRYIEQRPAGIPAGEPILHGHVHTEWTVTEQDGRRLINVGVDVHDYRPISDDRVLELLTIPI
ncbi:MAG: hypothetical protein AAGA90_23285 [Actinomycetota bacterium]